MFKKLMNTSPNNRNHNGFSHLSAIIYNSIFENKLTIVLLFFCNTFFAQQDAQYNLYQFNQMVINPAYAGARDGLAAIAMTRQQWVGFDGAPKTYALSVHSPIAKKNIGVGLTIVNDVMGARNVFAAYGNASYILKIDKKTKLSFGMNAGYNRYQFAFGKITFKEGEAVPTQFLSNFNRGALDINAGFYLRSKKYFVGVSATHLNTPKVYNYTATSATTANTFTYRINVHFFITAGYSHILNKNVIFAPTILIKEVKNNFGADLNLNFFLYKKFWVGAFYRNAYGPGFLFQYYIDNHLRVGYSYDTGISDANKLGGSHEVLFGFDLAAKKKSRLVNPRFL
jgi:type IX secretion system PorP/SprF family membrane protein